MLKYFYLLLLFIILSKNILYARDSITYKIDYTDDIAYFLIFHDGKFEQISKTFYSGRKRNKVNITNRLSRGDNYLIFLLFNLPYNFLFFFSGKWQADYYIIKNGKIIIKENPRGEDSRSHSLGIRASYVNRVRVDYDRRADFYYAYIKGTLFEYMIDRYNEYFIANKGKPNESPSQYLNKMLIKRENFFSKIFPFLREKTVKEFIVKNLFSLKMSKYKTLLYRMAKEKMRNSYRKGDLKELLFMSDHITKKFPWKHEISIYIKKLKLIYLKKILKYIYNNDQEKAREVLFNSFGIVANFNNNNISSILKDIIKRDKKDGKNNNFINYTLSDSKYVFKVNIKNSNIGEIDLSSDKIVSVCYYKKQFIRHYVSDAVDTLIKKCKKSGLDYYFYNNKKIYILLSNYKKLGYINPLAKNVKKTDFLWEALDKNMNTIDEYNTFKNELFFLKNYIKNSKDYYLIRRISWEDL